MEDEIILLILLVAFGVVLGLIISTIIVDLEQNAELLCQSHDLELVDYKGTGTKLEEVRCAKLNENIKVFEAG